ncbi:hypothetical protein PTSG_06972 [Salpingoeca rosetta]|uniref:BRO1 domain-containing protein n=1 Tax=Salpingoeca rosetta (strain ATCC 50818 / BSB-021) TaxID=946362 RepID=F2UFC2_SALR5|nr:uncharacterized protein PTSG_06972 [Salpingoeca rosetta]EGD75322.1 hypothetical protein PTSG_06972 [Salpingoeca rosetta]|eukprot:XP_004992375.1 hypothetical protein PTSG_06972 [Salpingoeca rosetta]
MPLASSSAPNDALEAQESEDDDAKKKNKKKNAVHLDGQSKNRALSSIIFKYSDNMAGKVFAHADFAFELSNMLMNFGLWHMKHASWLEDFSAPEAEREDVAKSIFTSLKTAAGVFKYLLDKHHEALEYRPNTDFDERMLKARYEQCLAEAQEGVLERARTMEHRPALIAGIAHDESRRYGLVADDMRSMEGNRAARHLHLYFQFKASFYKAYMWYFYGKHLMDEEQVGQSVRCFQDAKQELEESMRLAEAYTKEKSFMSAKTFPTTPPIQHPLVNTLVKLIKADESKAERENGLIFHQLVPKAPIEPPEPKECIQMIELTLPEPSDVWKTHTFEWDRIPRLGQDEKADKAAGDDAKVKHTPFDPVKHKGSSGAHNNVCTIS